MKFIWLVLASLFLSGCVDLAKVESMRSEAVKLREALHQESQKWESRIAALPPNDPLRADGEAALAVTKARAAAIDAAILELDQVIKEAKNPSDPLVSVTAPLLPEPLRSPYLLGAALLATLARAVQLKRGMASIAKSLEKAMEEDDQLRAGMKRSAGTLRSIQTRTAQKIVNQATGRGPVLALPI
jgi:hypothetical protein